MNKKLIILTCLNLFSTFAFGVTQVVENNSNKTDLDVTMGAAWANVQGDALTMERMSIYGNYTLNNHISVGPDLLFSESSQRVNLFDHYASIDFGVNAKFGMEIGSFFHFARVHGTIMSAYHAEGKLDLVTLSGEDLPNGNILFAYTALDTEGNPRQVKMEVNQPRVATANYQLEGRAPGVEVSIGSNYTIMDGLSLLGEFGYSARRLEINNIGYSYNYFGPGEYSLEGRKGFVAERDSWGLKVAPEGGNHRLLTSVMVGMGASFAF